jgi:hypothetical protein
MILDTRNEIADAQSIVLPVGTHRIGNQIDLGAVPRGVPLVMSITVDTAIIAAGAGTLQFFIATDAQAAIAVDGSASVHHSSGLFTTAATESLPLRAGNRLFGADLGNLDAAPSSVNPDWGTNGLINGDAGERYLGVYAVIGGSAITAGKVNIFLSPQSSNVGLPGRRNGSPLPT